MTVRTGKTRKQRIARSTSQTVETGRGLGEVGAEQHRDPDAERDREQCQITSREVHGFSLQFLRQVRIVTWPPGWLMISSPKL